MAYLLAVSITKIWCVCCRRASSVAGSIGILWPMKLRNSIFARRPSRPSLGNQAQHPIDLSPTTPIWKPNKYFRMPRIISYLSQSFNISYFSLWNYRSSSRSSQSWHECCRESVTMARLALAQAQRTKVAE